MSSGIDLKTVLVLEKSDIYGPMAEVTGSSFSVFPKNIQAVPFGGQRSELRFKLHKNNVNYIYLLFRVSKATETDLSLLRISPWNGLSELKYDKKSLRTS